MNAASWLESLPAGDRWRDFALLQGPKIATWVLALAIGVQAAVIVTDLAGGAPVPEAASYAPAAHTARPRINIAAITAANLMGAAQVEAQPDAANAPQTSMPLVLTGIIAAEDPSMGLAIIGQSLTSTKVYAVGDPLPGGAKLHSVHNDRVLLDRNGRVEALVLPRQSSSAGVTAPPPVAAARPAPQVAAVERVRQLVTEQPGMVADIMRPQPVFAQGKQRGFRVFPGRNRQAFVRLGLRPGDLVTAINGTPLDDQQRSAEIFQTLYSSSEARITVMRNGRQQDLVLNMAQVAQEAEQLMNADPSASGEAAQDQAAPPADTGTE
ncbi:MAG TPA: type II secretion system protein GspC [Steroidobacteraceae bacterium]